MFCPSWAVFSSGSRVGVVGGVARIGVGGAGVSLVVFRSLILGQLVDLYRSPAYSKPECGSEFDEGEVLSKITGSFGSCTSGNVMLCQCVGGQCGPVRDAGVCRGPSQRGSFPSGRPSLEPSGHCTYDQYHCDLLPHWDVMSTDEASSFLSEMQMYCGPFQCGFHRVGNPLWRPSMLHLRTGANLFLFEMQCNCDPVPHWEVMSADGASLLLSEMRMYLGPCSEWVSPSGKASLEALYAAPADNTIMTASVWGGMVTDGSRDLVQFLVARVRTYAVSREILVVPRGWAGVPGCIVSDERDEALSLSRSRLARIQTYPCGEGDLDCA
eukprot:g76872.t1